MLTEKEIEDMQLKIISLVENLLQEGKFEELATAIIEGLETSGEDFRKLFIKDALDSEIFTLRDILQGIIKSEI